LLEIPEEAECPKRELNFGEEYYNDSSSRVVIIRKRGRGL